jgi:predicted phosphodiesterase
MKIALFSDIHSNLPALEAFFKDVEIQQPDVLYCLGDLVGYNIWPNEVINEIRKRHIPTIAGNYDFGIGRKSNDCGCAYKEEHEKEMGKISIIYKLGGKRRGKKIFENITGSDQNRVSIEYG